MPVIGNCAVCDNGIILPFHDIELGWVCSGCVGHVASADFLLQRVARTCRPTGQIR